MTRSRRGITGCPTLPASFSGRVGSPNACAMGVLTLRTNSECRCAVPNMNPPQERFVSGHRFSDAGRDTQPSPPLGAVTERGGFACNEFRAPHQSSLCPVISVINHATTAHAPGNAVRTTEKITPAL